MVFSSITFLIYFLPVLLVIYFILDKQYKNIFLLLASIAFYSWGAPRFIFVILGTTVLDFYLVKFMDKAEHITKRRILLLTSITLNVGLLFYFKYANFFIENFNSMLSGIGINEIKALNVILPIGISFYTFESLTYVLDVYRRLHKPLTNFWNYQLYIILFPKLIAGPIIRYNEIADQITERQETTDKRLTGFLRFTLGLGKKVLIANMLAIKADYLFNLAPENVTTALAWLGSLSYTFQIYFDFSGYSDMAIGIGQMLGFKFPENFNNPYTSVSITDFWRRWHMTLGSWMKNYLYIPLGGNKVNSSYRLYLNLWIVFVLSGFWHGASWTFIIWGIYHGLFLILERLFLLKVYTSLGSFIARLIVFFLINIGWIFFRADTTSQAVHIISKLFSNTLSLPLDYVSNQFTFCFVLALLFSFFTIPHFGKRIQNFVYGESKPILALSAFTLIAIVIYFLSVINIAASGFNPFIYFRF